MHRSYELQGSLKRRRKHPHPTSINGYYTVKNGLGAIVYKWPTFTFVHESGYTLAFANRIAHSCLHAETGAVSDGGAITTLGAFHTFTNIPGPCIRKVYFAAFGPWPRVLPKNAESLRASDALMRVAVPRRRGPAGLRKPILLLQRGHFCTATSLVNNWNYQSRLLDVPTSIAKPSVFCYNILKSR